MQTTCALRILLVDDELLVLQSLRHLLEDGGHRVIATCTTPQEALRYLRDDPPQLVICDIFFDGEPLGVDLCAQLDQQRVPYFFITGQVDTDVIELTRGYHPLGLIYKPLDARDILTRIELRFGNGSERPVQQQTLSVNYRGRKQLIAHRDIVYLEADGNYCYLHTSTATRLPVLRSLQSIQKELAQLHFTRIHRSYSINPARVRSYTATEVRLEGGATLPIGRKYREDFMRWIRQF